MAYCHAGIIVLINSCLVTELIKSMIMHIIMHAPDLSLKAAAPSGNTNIITATVVPVIAVFLLSSIIFFIVGALCMKLLQLKTMKDHSEESISPAIQSQNNIIMVSIYENVHESVPNARNDYDLNKNIAYGRIVVH